MIMLPESGAGAAAAERAAPRCDVFLHGQQVQQKGNAAAHDNHHALITELAEADTATIIEMAGRVSTVE